jgi:TATA-binding protein-associated factor Taf7
MSSEDTLNRIPRPTPFRRACDLRTSDRETAIYVEDGWIFRVKPGAPIECVRLTSRADALSPVEAAYSPPAD